MLIENCFDVNQNVVTNLNGMGNTPIAHSACYNDDREMLQYLINKGADPNKKTSLKTPYILAMKIGTSLCTVG